LLTCNSWIEHIWDRGRGKNEKFFLTLVIFVSLTAFAFAAGGKNHGSKGQGSTGSDGKGTVTQKPRPD
jgi:hypothetical protein